MSMLTVTKVGPQSGYETAGSVAYSTGETAGSVAFSTGETAGSVACSSQSSGSTGGSFNAIA